MNLLIVDDEVFSVRAVKQAIGWEKLGFEQVFVAYNAEKAREIIRLQKIDLMLCDIEMPQEDGLSLFTWVKEQEKDLECIFLTCHADFSYAQRALHLGAFDYLVKPLDFEALNQIIQKAVSKIKLKDSIALERRNGSYWEENRQAIEERFWRELIIEQNWATPEEIVVQAERRGIPLDIEIGYRLAFFQVQRFRTRLDDEWDPTRCAIRPGNCCCTICPAGA